MYEYLQPTNGRLPFQILIHLSQRMMCVYEACVYVYAPWKTIFGDSLCEHLFSLLLEL